MPSCNGMDRGLNVTPPEREPTSAWSLFIREQVEPASHPQGDEQSPSGERFVLLRDQREETSK
jgi:hypothetical protein